jgi:hypothetical protein
MDYERRSEGPGKLYLLPSLKLLLMLYQQTFQRPLTQSDLDRYLFYGRKMRRLKVSNDYSPPNRNLSQINSNVFREIAVFLDLFHPGHVILPNLRELHCDDFHDVPLWEVIPYLSPSLERFRLDNQSFSSPPSGSAVALLSALSAKSPLIKHLRITRYSMSTAPAFLTFPNGLVNLSTFECPGIPISHNAIIQLAHLPNLINMSLYFPDDHASGLSKLALPATPFSSLRQFTLKGTHFVSGIKFISTCLRSASLEFIGVCALEAPSFGEIHQLFSTFALSLQLKALTGVHLYHPGYTFGENDLGSPLENMDFEPLLQFHNLEACNVELTSVIEHLSDTLLDTISLAWPRLTCLCFDTFDFTPGPSQCTLEGILLLAKRCPNLRSLAIPFMASVPISWKGRPGEGTVNESMEELDVRRSPIVDPDMVASFLSDIFPNLVRIRSWDALDNYVAEAFQYHELWEEAIRLYKRYTKIRKEERAWAVYQGRIH